VISSESHKHVLSAHSASPTFHNNGSAKRKWGVLNQRPTHFLMKTLPKVATEMALHVLAVMNIVGIKPLLAAIRA
jgi:hypothetical protein